jgi:2'-5' RNA ligase
MARRRLFYAIWPEPAERAALAAAAQSLFPLSGRPVAAADFHITLAFVGAVDDARLAAFQALAQPLTPFDVTLDALEHWPKPRVLVAAARHASSQLAATVAALWRQLDRLGVAREPRPFQAHATLARDVRQWRSGRSFPAVTWTATRIRLVESRSDASPRYAPLDTAAQTA